MTISRESCDELYTRAVEASNAAYAPYSQFRVGAAVLGASGIYLGANIENASYGLSQCAERVALSNALINGDRDIRAIAVACVDAALSSHPSSIMPCGACRQWLIELASDALVLVRLGTDLKSFAVRDLLPQPFFLNTPHRT